MDQSTPDNKMDINNKLSLLSEAILELNREVKSDKVDAIIKKLNIVSAILVDADNDDSDSDSEDDKVPYVRDDLDEGDYPHLERGLLKKVKPPAPKSTAVLGANSIANSSPCPDITKTTPDEFHRTRNVVDGFVKKKFLKSNIVPKSINTICECKYGDKCWSVTCIRYHNEKQRNNYRKFFLDNPKPIIGSDPKKYRIDIDEWDKKRCEYWVNSIRNNVGGHFITTNPEHYDITIIYD